MSDSPGRPNPVIRVFTLQEVEPDTFIAPNPQEHGRLFGGLVAGQAVMAAGLTARSVPLHSLHAYFLRPGRPLEPVRFEVTRLKEGRNFQSRQVLARQRGEVIFSMMASFTLPEEGISHQRPLPATPAREQGSEHTLWSLGTEDDQRGFEMVVCDDRAGIEPRRYAWFRPRVELPDDPLLHTALITFLSDFRLMSTGAMYHDIAREKRRGASLDHAMWFHRVPRIQGWMLHAMESPAAHSSRALNYGAIYDESGTLLVSVAQEGLIRRATPKPETAGA